MADHETIVGFQLAMALETEDMQLDEAMLSKGVEAVLTDPQKGTYFVTEDEGEVIACLSITYEWSDWRNGMVWWIQSVYVSPSHRGKSVYGKMYQHLQEQVKADPALRGIRLYVDKRNRRAARVYEKYGMDGEHYQLYEWLKR